MHLRTHLAQAVALATLIPGVVMAQFEIEEIVVTAQKRAQSVNDIGIAVSAFSGDDVRDLRLENPIDLAGFTPGLSTANAVSDGIPIFSIRGVGLDDFNTNNSGSVGVYIDELFMTSPAMSSFQVFDVERVEVLKGPQGTLYGRNTTGGAINFVSRKPSDEFDVYINTNYSRWNRLEVTGAIGGSLRDDLNARLAAYYVNGDGWQEDTVTGENYAAPDKWALRALLNWNINEDVDVLLNVHGGQNNSTTTLWQADDSFGLGIGSPGATSGRADQVADALNGVSTIGGPDKPEINDESFGASITANAALEFADFTSITGWEQLDHNSVELYDGSPLALNDRWARSDIEQFSQEFRLSSNNDDNDFNWILGLSYGAESISTEDNVLITQAIDILYVTPIALGGYGLPAGGGFTPTENGSSSSSKTQYDQESESYGLFAHTEWTLSDELKLITGLRYSYESRDFDGQVIDNEGFVLFTPPNTVLASLKDSHDEDNISGKIGLEWTPNDNWLLYASAATGFKSGVFYGAGVPDQSGLGYVPPEELTAFELGFKATLLDSTLQLNGAAYFYTYEDKQVLLTTSTPVGPVATLGTVPESEINGFEMDAWWRPLQGLDIKAGVAYINTKVTEGTDNVRGTPLLGGSMEEGRELSLSPEWSYNLLTSYNWNLNDQLSAKVQIDYAWQDDGVAATSDPLSAIETQKGLGGRLSLSSRDDIWEVALWGKNLENENNTTYAYTNFLGDRSFSLQQPRSYGVSFRYNWH